MVFFNLYDMDFLFALFTVLFVFGEVFTDFLGFW